MQSIPELLTPEASVTIVKNPGDPNMQIIVKLAAAHPAVELRGMLRAAALVVLVCRTVPKHVAL